MQLDTPPAPNTPENMPGRIRELRSLRRSVVLWLLVFGVANLVLALYLISASVRNDIARSGTTLDSIQEMLIRLSTPAPEVQALRATLTATHALADALEAARPPAGVNWPAVMAFITNYSPTEITLTSLTQAGNRITLTGQATDELAVVEYANALKESNFFSDVVTQSLKLLTADPDSAEATPEETIEFVVVLILNVQSS